MKRCTRFVGGAQRSGTTALKFYIDQHPMLTTGTGKEVHFYDRWYSKAPTKVLRDSLHRAKFEKHAAGHLVDISPSYMFLPGAVERLASDRSGAKVVLVLRSPVARAVSQWRLESHRGDETLIFSEAIRRPAAVQDPSHHTYLPRGKYDEQLARVFAACGRDNVLVLRSEEFRDDPVAQVARMWTHFEVDPIDPTLPSEPVHASQVSFEPSVKDVTFMLDYFSRSIERTSAMLDWDPGPWLDPGQAAVL